jgi:hypothetical protein
MDILIFSFTYVRSNTQTIKVLCIVETVRTQHANVSLFDAMVLRQGCLEMWKWVFSGYHNGWKAHLASGRRWQGSQHTHWRFWPSQEYAAQEQGRGNSYFKTLYHSP